MALLKVYRKQCKNCLMSKDRIVSPKRAKEIINSTLEEDTHFTCHKATMNGNEDICCKGYFDAFKDKNRKLKLLNELNEQAGGLIIEEVELPNEEKYPPYREYKN